MARKKLGEMLVEAGVLSEQGLRAALNEQRRWGGTLGHKLVDMKLVSEAELVRVLSLQLSIPTVEIDKLDISPDVIDLIPLELAHEHYLIPFAQQMKFLDVAMADPTNLGILDELRIRTQLNIRPYLAGPRMIERALARYYPRGFSRMHRPDVAVPLVEGADVMDAPAPLPTKLADAFPRQRPRQTSTSPSPPPTTPGAAAGLGPAGPPALSTRDAEIDALQDRISRLEALVARDEEVLRKLLALLVDKRVATREEILEYIK
jgi:hypothetical protein